MSVQVHVHRDAEAAALAAAQRFIEIGRSAIDLRGRFCVALAGGTTPIRMYEMLAEPGNILDWGLVHVFFTDERCVPFDHADSNYARVRRCLLDRVDVPEVQVHRIESELAPYHLAAQRYDSLLRSFFWVRDGQPSRQPTFDLVLLGVGEDGHIASLFPGSGAVAEERRWALHTQAPKDVEPRDRITLTLPVINAARHVMFLVSGVNKSHIVRPLLAGLGNPGWPAAMIRCAGGVEWFLDEAAAGVAENIRGHKPK